MKKYMSYTLCTTAVVCVVVGYGVAYQPVNNTRADNALPKVSVDFNVPFVTLQAGVTAKATNTVKPELAGLPATYLDGIDADKAFEQEEAIGPTTLHHAQNLQALFADSWNDSAMHMTLVKRFLDKHFANKTKSMQFFDFYKRYYVAKHLQDNVWTKNNTTVTEKLQQTRNVFKAQFTQEQYNIIYKENLAFGIIESQLEPIVSSNDSTEAKINKVKALFAAETDLSQESKKVFQGNIIENHIILRERYAAAQHNAPNIR